MEDRDKQTVGHPQKQRHSYSTCRYTRSH
uniref:Uncharacterized protein n=1 Tax=Arundo donax TaxID=35708 RepID=A0A0A9F823_ARUDO